MRVLLVVVAAASQALLCGCGKLGFSPEDALAGLPDDFKETKGDARIMPAGGIAPKERQKNGKMGRLDFHQKATAGNPYCGAVLRLIPEKVEGREEYKKFLLPKLILHYSSPYPAAITVDFGDAAKKIHKISPAGDNYIGLLPSFDQKWLRDIGDGGAVGQRIQAQAIWTKKLRSEDLILGGEIAVTSIYHFPKEDIYPLAVSLIDPRSPFLPLGGNAGGVLSRSLGQWLEGVFLGKPFPSNSSPSTIPPENGRGWVLFRPLEEAVRDQKTTVLEASIILASMALRDGVPCWLAIFPDQIFLFLGNTPGQAGSYVISPKRLLTGEDTRRGFYAFLEGSRTDYLSAVTSVGEPKFINAEDHSLYHPIPVREKEKEGGGRKRSGADGDKTRNPFDRPL